jgi:hypothetical protein
MKSSADRRWWDVTSHAKMIESFTSLLYVRPTLKTGTVAMTRLHGVKPPTARLRRPTAALDPGNTAGAD